MTDASPADERNAQSGPRSVQIDYLCWDRDCLGGGRWGVLVDAVSHEPLDPRDTDCPSCGSEGQPEHRR